MRDVELAGLFNSAEGRVIAKVGLAPLEGRTFVYDREFLSGLATKMADPTGEAVVLLDRWTRDGGVERASVLTGWLEESLNLLTIYEDSPESFRTHAGAHGIDNLAHVLSEVLRVVDGSEIPDYARWELLVSATTHNFGRLILQGDEDSSHQTTGVLFLRELLREANPRGNPSRLSKEEELLGRRIFADVFGHSTANNGDPIADLIKSADRFQQVVPFGPSRYLIRDVGEFGMPLMPVKDRAGFPTRLPVFYPPDKNANWLEYCEFMARNLYPFETDKNGSNPEGYKKMMRGNSLEGEKRRALQVAFLTFLVGGQQTDLYQQTFAPELGNAVPEHWSKRILPAKIFYDGQACYCQYLQEGKTPQELRGLTDEQRVIYILTFTNSFVPENSKTEILRQFDTLDERSRAGFVSGLEFLFTQYELRLAKEGQLSRRMSESDDPNVVLVAGFVKRYLESKIHTITR